MRTSHYPQRLTVRRETAALFRARLLRLGFAFLFWERGTAQVPSGLNRIGNGFRRLRCD
jgi:hypothetical protein